MFIDLIMPVYFKDVNEIFFVVFLVLIVIVEQLKDGRQGSNSVGSKFAVDVLSFSLLNLNAK